MGGEQGVWGLMRGGRPPNSSRSDSFMSPRNFRRRTGRRGRRPLRPFLAKPYRTRSSATRISIESSSDDISTRYHVDIFLAECSKCSPCGVFDMFALANGKQDAKKTRFDGFSLRKASLRVVLFRFDRLSFEKFTRLSFSFLSARPRRRRPRSPRPRRRRCR